MGKRFSGSKIAVCEPAHRHFPLGVGVSTIGGGVFARSSCDVTATIGCEKETLRNGAIGTAPIGAWRVTVSAPPLVTTAGGGREAGGGKASVMVLPGRGAGCDRSR